MDQDLVQDVLDYVTSCWASTDVITWRNADGFPMLNAMRIAIALGYAPEDDVRRVVTELVDQHLLRYNDDPENGLWLRPKVTEN